VQGLPAHQPKQQEAVQAKPQLANTCYLYVPPKAPKSLAEALHALELVASKKQQELIVACSSADHPSAKALEGLLKQDGYSYTQAKIELPQKGHDLSIPNLGRSISLVSALAGSHSKVDEEDEEQEAARHQKASSKRIK